jgi:hypothetical protein
MRCTLALCVVLAIGGSAWSAEQAPVITGSVVQTPAVSNPAPATTPTGMIPTMPAPTIGSPATTVAGTQPMMTYPTGNMTYYPANYGYRRGLFGRNYTTYTTAPGQTVYTTTTYPAQVTYAPARRGLFGLGLFQGRRRQVYPTYTTSAPMTTGAAYYYPPSNYNNAVPAGTRPGTVPSTASAPAGTTPTYTETQFQAPTGTTPAGAAPVTTLPQATTPTTITPPAPPVPQGRTPGGTP